MSSCSSFSTISNVLGVIPDFRLRLSRKMCRTPYLMFPLSGKWKQEGDNKGTENLWQGAFILFIIHVSLCLGVLIDSGFCFVISLISYTSVVYM